MVVYLFVVIQIYNKFSGFLLFFTIIYNLSLEMSDEPKLGDSSPLVIQKKNFAIAYIKRLVNINCQCFYILLISIFFASCSWIGMRFLNGSISFWVLVTIAALTIIVIGYIIYLAIRILKQYRNDIKI